LTFISIALQLMY